LSRDCRWLSRVGRPREPLDEDNFTGTVAGNIKVLSVWAEDKTDWPEAVGI
jgi:hypothetical protein